MRHESCSFPSGALLEIAQQMSKVKPQNTVRLAWWGAEESGLIGSREYVAELSQEERDRIALYLNFDMVASPNYIFMVYDGDESGFEAPVVVPEGSVQIEDLFESYFTSVGLPYDDAEFSGRSDYQAFINAGIPAGGLFTGAEVMKSPEQQAVWGGIAGESFDQCYHRACDTIDNVDLEALDVNVVQVAAVSTTTTTTSRPISTSRSAEQGRGCRRRCPRSPYSGRMETIVKRRDDAPESFFEAEAAGLAWLAAAGGARTVGVVAVSPGRIELERVEEAHPNRRAAEAFGAALARTHAAGAPAFGAPPDGWTGPLFIGRRRLPAAEESTWGAFYARERVLPYLEIAEEVGNTTAAEGRLVRQAAEAIAAGAFDDDEPPARIHGDLWHGNVLWSAEGVVLIDPAAHGGHRETDLAMLALFGCPFLGDVLAAYVRAAPLRAGWSERVPLHQLHPLAVHAAGHGRGYGVALAEAAATVLELVGRTRE